MGFIILDKKHKNILLLQNEFIHNNDVKEIYNVLKKFNINKKLEKLENILNCYFKPNNLFILIFSIILLIINLNLFFK
jgi:hypothetical protein